MAQPIIVAGATAESGAAVGPVKLHGRGNTAKGQEMSRDQNVRRDIDRKSEPRHAAMQIIFVRPFDPGGDDLAYAQRATA